MCGNDDRLNARKIPLAPIPIAVALIFAAAGAGAQTPAADTTALFRQARRAEVAYEASIRRYAPTQSRRAPDRTCDEVVGRFCLFFDSGKDTLPAEPAEIRVARDTAIAALGRAFDAAPYRPELARPLVRYLTQAGQTEAAEARARTHAGATADTAGGHLLLGYALHHARRTAAAAAEFERWLVSLSLEDRKRVTSIEWLVDRRVSGEYRKVPAADRAALETRFWRYADPLYLTPGNELYTEHLARHALAHMLSARPSIANTEAWGDDLEQLAVRFGPPAITTRSWRSGSMGTQFEYSEHWDPAQRIYFAPALAAMQISATPDTVWPFEDLPTRSGHAPPTIRLMRILEHQAAVMPGRAPVFVLYGRAELDSLTNHAALTARVFLLDSALNVLADGPATIAAAADSVAVRAVLPLPPATRFYSAEVYDLDSRYAARARFALEEYAPAGRLALSGILLAEPFEPGRLPEGYDSALLRPLNRPVIEAGSRLGIYSEVAVVGGGAGTIHVELENRRQDGKSALGRAVGWIGQKIGLSSPKSPARLGWNVDVLPDTANALPVTLDLSTLEPGRYTVSIAVRRPGQPVASTRRELRIVSGAKASSSSRP